MGRRSSFCVYNAEPEKERGETEMRNSHPEIKIYRAEPGKSRKKRGMLSLFFMQTAVLCILIILWWNAFLSVFHMPFHRGWLYAGVCIWIILYGWTERKFRWKACVAGLVSVALLMWLCRETILRLYQWTVQNYTSVLSGYPAGDMAFSGIAVLASIPAAELLMAVQRKGRGKGWAALILMSPFFAAAAAGAFQPILPAWLLIAGTAVYFASSGLDEGIQTDRRKPYIWKYAVFSVLVSAALAFLSFQAGKLLDVQRDAENGYYMQTRGMIQSKIIGGVREILEKNSSEKIPEEDRYPDEEVDGAEQENSETENNTDPGVEFPVSMGESEMGNLGSLAYFSPKSGQVSLITLDEKPERTVYVLLRWGVVYSDNSWTEEDMTKSVLAPEEAYKSYPEELRDILEELCGGWNTGSLQEVSGEISRELSERAVYNTSPGMTPAGKDFVEYFLLENHKGFCVHFATAATLMYRYCGYTARYAEGYAVPAAAFRQNDSGGYVAEITGDMGHAWCQVYDERTGEWMDMEHTPPAPEGADIQPPASDSAREGAVKKASDGKSFDQPVWVFAVLAAAGILLFFVQAAVRNTRRNKRFFGKDRSRGICEMYRGIIKTAEFQGMEVKDPLAENMGERLGEMYPELKQEEWNWVYACVMENMFYHQKNKKENWKKMRRLYVIFRKAACSRMKRSEKWRFRYVRCL